ncbi:hypothetical protein BGZ79_007839 [Entomortierella chlamydospora]|nr:hypothetical protein BGZ79_007839 [Entomortierella chlamydospora]
MNSMDLSLDDIIKAQRNDKKSKKAPAAIQSRSAAIRAKNGKSAKSASPYARPGTVKKETALFTESYKAAKAPVTEIFTAGYIPKPATTLKLFTTNYKKGGSAQTNREEATTGPLTTKPLKLVTTQSARRETPAAPAPKLTLTTQRNNGISSHGNDERIPTNSRGSGQSDPASLNRGGDYYRPNDRNDRRGRDDRNERHDRSDRNDRNERGDRGDRNGGNGNVSKGGDRRGIDTHSNARSGRGSSPQQQTGRNQHTNVSSNNQGNRNNNPQGSGSIHRTPDQRPYQDSRSQQAQPAPRISEAKPASSMDMDMDMDTDEGTLSFVGSAPNSSVAFRGESGPVTIEIENLDPGTTAEDVKYVCSKFGEIRSCMCMNGFSQVTYARKAAGLAAIENLHGKKADNGKILRVTMRKNAILHEDTASPVPHVPSPIAGPMKILTKAVQGTITNAGTLYSDQLLAAQHMLKVQQHRMAQLQREEQRISSLRMQTEPQLSDLNSLSTSGVHRGFF